MGVGYGRSWQAEREVTIALTSDCGHMHIRLANPELMPDLLAFLERVHCAVERTGPDTVDASIAEALDVDQAHREITLYLAAWLAVRPGGVVYVAAARDAPHASPAH